MCARVVLFSHDQVLAESCRAGLAALFGGEFTLLVASPGELLSQHDLVLWDFVPGETWIPLDSGPERPQRYSFLLHREDLKQLHDLVGNANPHMLLKPFAPAELVAFLGDLGRRWKGQQNGSGAHTGTITTERDELLQRLMLADLKLQEQNQERMNFLMRCIHDFRAPLTAINGYCGLFLEGRLGDVTTEQLAIIERMQHSTRRLSRMVETMSRLSDQNADGHLELERNDIRACVDLAIQDITAFIASKRILVNVDLEPPEFLVFDKSQVEQILINLLDNACKFTPRAGTIEIKGYPFFWDRRNRTEAPLHPTADRRKRQLQAPNSFRIDIRDSGPGIPPVHLAKIFEGCTACFEAQDRSGGGLGLALSKFIIHRHHGCLWAESRATGAVFSFVLPLQLAELHVETARGTNGN